MLKFDAVSKSFGDRRVLDALTFEVRAGEIYGLLGPNGAGKSTAFNIICNLTLPDSGAATIDGNSPGSISRCVLGVVAQQIALYQNLTARENLEFFGALYGVRGARLSARVKACLHDVHLSDRASSVVHNLSGGMQRRLHVASSLVHEPRLVILDEPSVGLDVESRQHLWALVRKLQAQGSAVLLTTHLLEEAEALCSRVAILRNGHIVAEGTPEALRARIPAVEIAFVQSPALTDIVEAARKNGLQTRPFETGVAIWLDRKMELREVIELFGNLPVDSLSRRPVTLEDAYTELSRTEH